MANTTTTDKIKTEVEKQLLTTKKYPEWTRWIGTFLTVLTLSITAVVWASSEHSSIKSWMLDQSNTIKKELQNDSEKNYVPKEDFSRIDQSIRDQKEDIKEIKDKLDKIFDLIHKNSQNK